MTSCNEANNVIFSRAEECLKQEQEQGEEQTEDPQQEQEQPRSTIPQSEDESSLKSPPITTVSPSRAPKIKRLDLGRDFKEGQIVTAGENEILAIGLGAGGWVDLKGGASFSYKETDSEITFESLAGSIRYFFEGFTKPRYVTTSKAVTSVRGTDFVINENPDKTEVWYLMEN